MSLNIEKVNNSVFAKVWNRTYVADSKPVILSSILSGGNEILAEPIALYVESDGTKCEFCDAVTRLLVDENGKKNILRSFQSRDVVIDICEIFEEDGAGDISFSIMPRGRVSSHVPLDPNFHFAPNKFYLEVKIKKEFAKYYHLYPHNFYISQYRLYGSEELVTYNDMRHNLNASNFLPGDGFYTSFREQLYVSGDNGGLAFIFHDDKNWKPEDKTKAFEVIRCEDGDVKLRFHLFDSMPKLWENLEGNGIDFPPLTYNFALMATPIKPFPVDNFYERNFHLDCFIKIQGEFDEFLGKEYEQTGENCYDRLKRLGVDVLYIHERWNDIQNYPYLTEETLKRAKTIVSECHKRGIKVIPYFGYELSVLTSTFAKRGDEFIDKFPGFPGWHWYRYPYQRDLIVCPASEWSDIMYEGICKVYDECGFDGLYFDGTLEPHRCNNTAHGCGYTDENGELQVTYPIWEGREFIKKIYEFVKSRGGTINVHGNGAYSLLTFAYCDSIWEGETFQKLLLKDQIDYIPEGVLQARFTGRDTGIPVYSLCYSNPDNWSFKNGISISMLHGSVPKPVDIGEPLELMSKIWDALDNFPLKEAKWKPYWEGTDKITCDCDEIKISSWETEDRYLVVCTSCTKDFEKTVTITSHLPIVKDILADKTVSENGSFKATLKGIDCVIFTAEK